MLNEVDMANPRGKGDSSTVVMNLLTETKQTGTVDEIKKALFTYCLSVHEDLNNHSGKIGKYLKVSPSPATIESEDLLKRNLFLTQTNSENVTAFDRFYLTLNNVLNKLTPSDIATIGHGPQTQTAQEFLACLDDLNRVGFYNVNDKPINFWSGDEAQEKADTTLTSLSDSNIPAISIFIKLGNLFKEKGDDARADKLFAASSAAFTAQAVGKVEIFMSAYNANELPSLPAGNFHWNEERGILQNRLHSKEKWVTNVVVSFYDRVRDLWQDPISHNDKQIRVVFKRRGDIPEQKAQRDEWVNQGKVRPSIKLGKLVSYGQHWKNVTKARVKARDEKQEVKKEQDSHFTHNPQRKRKLSK